MDLRWVWILNFHVKRTDGLPMPTGHAEAWVASYCEASDYKEAGVRAIQKLSAEGYDILDVGQDGGHMPMVHWRSHMIDQFPEQFDLAYSQEEFEALIKEGHVVLGPFRTFSSHPH